MIGRIVAIVVNAVWVAELSRSPRPIDVICAAMSGLVIGVLLATFVMDEMLKRMEDR